MILHNVAQGSAEWLALRLGVPTCSRASEIITPGEGKASASQEGYRDRLLTEWMFGRSLDELKSGFMDRGNSMEDEAAKWYAFDRGVVVKPVGFITVNDGTFGGSPDRLVGEDGLLQVKCPSAHVHLGYFLDGLPVKEYKCQLQTELWVAERAWVDILSYHPDIPPVVVRVVRDEPFLLKWEKCLAEFRTKLEAGKAKLAPLREARLAAMAAAAEGEGDGQELV